MICSDLHPFTKVIVVLEFGNPVLDYFSSEIIEFEMPRTKFYDDEKRKNLPKCSIRRYTFSEIINSVIKNGFIIKGFNEHPAWTDIRFPGEFTIIADKTI